MKEITGYDYDRIYVIRGNNQDDFWSIAIDDNGDTNGSWVSHTSLPLSLYSGDNIFYVGGQRLFLTYGGNDSVYYWKFPDSPSATGDSWVQFDGWFPKAHDESGGRAPVFHAKNHLCSKVEVDEDKVTQYWIFANKSRIVVVTKTYQSSYSSEYNFAYAGMFDSIYDTSFATTQEDTSSGSNTIKVNNTSIFTVGSKYQMIDFNDDGILTEMFNGEARRISKSCNITISAVKQSSSEVVIEGTLVDDYSSGSRIGEDLCPVGVFVYGADEFQTLNNQNIADDRLGYDISSQTYKVKTTNAIQTLSERVDGIIAWPISLKHDGISQIINEEVRGHLIGVYSVGSLTSESTVEINGETYMSFCVFNSNALGNIIVGPIE
jgi:hypothetical protein